MEVEKKRENGTSEELDKAKRYERGSEDRQHSESKGRHKKKRSRSRYRSRSRKNKDKKSKKTRKRSSDDDRSRSRSESRKKSKKKRSRDRDTDRSRDRKKKTRSRSRGKHRSKSKSPSPPKLAKSKSDKRGSFRFDSPPKEVKVQQEHEKVSLDLISQLIPMGKPEVNTMEILQKVQIINSMQASQASKADRKLYIGNLPTGLTQQALVDLLNAALAKMGINQNPGKSIISAWISADGHYAFVEFRSAEEANNGFALNNVAIHGQPLKVGRPRTYNQQQTSVTPLVNIIGQSGMLPTMGIIDKPNPEAILQQSTMVAKVHPPSRILVLKNMIQQAQLEIDEEYNDLMSDVKEECERYGKVLALKAPRPKGGIILPGVGKIYVEYSAIDEAKEARRALSNRLFEGSKVECAFHSEEKFHNDDFTDPQ